MLLFSKLCLPVAAAVLSGAGAVAAEAWILNASFDVSRELFEELNPLFQKQWQEQTGERVRVYQSHAGSAKQARAVADGLPADVVVLNQPLDLELLVTEGRIEKEWREQFQFGASPFTSATVFMVRGGNALGICDWSDLMGRGVKVILANPRTSGAGRYAYLSAWVWAQEHFKGEERQVRQFITDLYGNAPMLALGGRAATTTFMQRGVGDVLVGLEAEILSALRESKSGKFELIRPSLSIETEIVMAVVKPVVKRRRSAALAEGYLRFLYSDLAQATAVRHGYRARGGRLMAESPAGNGRPRVISVKEAWGDWKEVQRQHFDRGGVFDQVYKPDNKYARDIRR